MNLTTTTEQLHPVLGECVTGSGIEILSHALLQAEDDKLTVTSTDTLMESVSTIPAEVRMSGQCTVDPRKLRAVMNGLDGDLNLNHEQARVVVKHDRRRFNLDSYDANSFPLANDDDEQAWENCDTVALAEAIQEVAYACSEKEHRHFCQGVWIGSSDVVATDGLRMACVTGMDDSGHSLIVPKAALAPICKLLHDADARVAVLYNSNTEQPHSLRVATPNRRLTTRLIQGAYIRDYRRMVPNANDAALTASVKSADLIAAIGRLNAIDQVQYKKFKALMCRISSEEGRLRIESGRGSVDYIDADITGELELMAARGDQLKQALENCGASKVTLHLWNFEQGKHNSLLLQPENGNSEHVIVEVKP